MSHHRRWFLAPIVAVLGASCGSSTTAATNDLGTTVHDSGTDVGNPTDASTMDVVPMDSDYSDLGPFDLDALAFEDIYYPDHGFMQDIPGDVGPGRFICGATTCRANIEYCYVVEGGAIFGDSGLMRGGTCTPLPAACTLTPTCGCIQAAVHSCITLCSNDMGGVIATCEAP